MHRQKVNDLAKDIYNNSWEGQPEIMSGEVAEWVDHYIGFKLPFVLVEVLVDEILKIHNGV